MVIEYSYIYKGNKRSFELDGHPYSISLTDYDQNRGFASCILIDELNGSRYVMDNRVEVNGHTFMAKFNFTWDFTVMRALPDTKGFKVLIDE